MTVKELLKKVRQNPDSVEFDETMSVIEQNYHYTPSRWVNGDIVNEPGENEGACKIFYFGQLHALSETEVLNLFGNYYRQDVMGDPAGEEHPNIREFILDGWLGVRFDTEVLTEKVRLH